MYRWLSDGKFHFKRLFNRGKGRFPVVHPLAFRCKVTIGLSAAEYVRCGGGNGIRCELHTNPISLFDRPFSGTAVVCIDFLLHNGHLSIKWLNGDDKLQLYGDKAHRMPGAGESYRD